MKIKLVSDLHLEFSDILIKNDEGCDVLILSGDIMIAQDLHDHPEPANTADQQAIANGTGLGRRQQAAQRFRDFLKRCSFSFPHVVYIAGNHEFYNGKFYAGIDYLRDECAKYPNIYYLENDTKVIDDVTFIGATLWTDMNKGDPLTMHAIEGMMNDFRIVRNEFRSYAPMSARDVATRHAKTLQYFRTVLAEQHDKKFVVVGHHSPSFQSVHPTYAHETLMNGGYHSDLSEFILDHPQIKLWTHGHTHHPFDYMIGETRIVCNPRGYENEGYSEDTGWNPNIVLEV
ncbi:Calcineurin-like phosphoesterase domain, ApaH type [uncultured Caudovirales phage]|uniref:Calcineurin-like phosphoesterase domain, ApaH type n=1 Tax=uncultured Caudovirales phage TaxID=2100421 RepID=A0A6J5TAC5_9CAUD|nr:Calcineurin-like phosphoesterase domain, ApaH type [uncultured Caudovirales phage]